MQQGVEQRMDATQPTTAAQLADIKAKILTGTETQPETSKLIPYEGGATRRVESINYALVPHSAVEAIARRLTKGAAIHGENNWRGGGEAFWKATKSHLLKHVMAYLEGDTTDDHADAIICNAAFIVEYEARKRRTPVQGELF